MLLYGFGKVKLPHHLEYLRLETNFVILNVWDIVVDELEIETHLGFIDLSMFTITKKVTIKDNSFLGSVTVRLPRENRHVVLINDVIIENKDDIVIEKIEMTPKQLNPLFKSDELMSLEEYQSKYNHSEDSDSDEYEIII